MRRTILLLSAMGLAVLLVSGVALALDKTCQANTDCFGTNKADTLTGSSGNDQIFGRGGNDLIRGLSGGDRLFGGRGKDDLRGGADGESIGGGGGDDVIHGGSADDGIHADNGNDTVFGGPGVDEINVSGDQADGFKDEVFCGDQVVKDFVAADANDILHGDCKVS